MRFLNHPTRQPARRRGFSLTELLVVMLIVLLLGGIALPVLAPALDSRRMRESSRLVTSYLAGARAAAMRTGRPVGVRFHRFEQRDPSGAVQRVGQYGVTLSQVQVPEPYTGDSLSSRMTIIYQVSPDAAFAAAPVPYLKVTDLPSDSFWQQLVRPGDFVRLGLHPQLYQIMHPVPGTAMSVNSTTGYLNAFPWRLQPANDVGVLPPLPYPADNPPVQVTYQIFPQPVRSAAEPLQLPGSVAIDFTLSGTGAIPLAVDPANDSNNPGYEFAPVIANDPYDIDVIFSPQGGIDRIYYSVSDGAGGVVRYGKRVTTSLYFLLGQRERAMPFTAPKFLLSALCLSNATNNLWSPDKRWNPASTDDDTTASNLWISIQPQTGLATSSPMGDLEPYIPTSDPGAASYPALAVQLIEAARSLAKNEQGGASQ